MSKIHRRKGNGLHKMIYQALQYFGTKEKWEADKRVDGRKKERQGPWKS